MICSCLQIGSVYALIESMEDATSTMKTIMKRQPCIAMLEPTGDRYFPGIVESVSSNAGALGFGRIYVHLSAHEANPNAKVSA
jgi:hypothetical protein